LTGDVILAKDGFTFRSDEPLWAMGFCDYKEQGPDCWVCMLDDCEPL